MHDVVDIFDEHNKLRDNVDYKIIKTSWYEMSDHHMVLLIKH